jgi:hypothetical protein
MMDPHFAAMFRLADQIAQLRARLPELAGHEREGALRLGLARMQWALDGLIDDCEGVIEVMPWWLEWGSRSDRHAH